MDRRSFLKTLAMVGVAPLMVPARAPKLPPEALHPATYTFWIKHARNAQAPTMTRDYETLRAEIRRVHDACARVKWG